MTTGATPQAAVEIDPPYAYVGPGHWIQATVLGFLEDSAVAVETAGGPLEVTVHPKFEPGIDLPDDLVGIGMLAPGILLGLVRMAARTILGRDH
jgi:hypothetical protein